MTPLVQNAALFVLGLVILVVGAESLIRGAVRVARRFGISPFVIGLTLVGFGTSAPELVVNLSAALRGAPGLALGNVIGSNVANVGLILGLAALLRPLTAQMRLLKVELPLMVGICVLLLFLCRDGQLSRAEGAALLVGFVVMMAYLFRTAREEPPEVKAELGQYASQTAAPPWAAAGLVAIGLVGLVAGAELMVRAAVEIAREFGISDLIIGLTVVAVGTSLPELASTAVAAYRGESDIAVGNVVGSNIFNVLLILGVTAAVYPLRMEFDELLPDLIVMCLFAAALIPVLLNGLNVTRWEGVLFLVAYAGFIAWQVVRATG